MIGSLMRQNILAYIYTPGHNFKSLVN